MIIFAGIHEVTQELDDMVAFDFNTQKWIYLFGEAQSADPSPAPGNQSPLKNSSMVQSPTRLPGVGQGLKKQLTQKKQEKPKEVIVPTKKDKKKGEADGPQIELTDPTSVTLINSYLVKNAGPTFDNYQKNMVAKKKAAASFIMQGNSPTQGFGMNN